ncbi:hypothetical protein AB4140_15220, partial [Shewanella sp. 10N.286.51.B2]|uniref:hypothetical protein n=1 Tax=Shewanella sp. 10N.286.51.B2 TaxID=3229707 RepID=UPI00354F6411
RICYTLLLESLQATKTSSKTFRRWAKATTLDIFKTPPSLASQDDFNLWQENLANKLRPHLLYIYKFIYY